MNSSIVVLRDGTPCLVYDEDLPHVRYAEYCPENALISLVWVDSQTRTEGYRQLDYPLPENFFKLLNHYRFMAVGQVKNDEILDLHMIPIDTAARPRVVA